MSRYLKRLVSRNGPAFTSPPPAPSRGGQEREEASQVADPLQETAQTVAQPPPPQSRPGRSSKPPPSTSREAAPASDQSGEMPQPERPSAAFPRRPEREARRRTPDSPSPEEKAPQSQPFPATESSQVSQPEMRQASLQAVDEFILSVPEPSPERRMPKHDSTDQATVEGRQSAPPPLGALKQPPARPSQPEPGPVEEERSLLSPPPPSPPPDVRRAPSSPPEPAQNGQEPSRQGDQRPANLSPPAPREGPRDRAEQRPRLVIGQLRVEIVRPPRETAPPAPVSPAPRKRARPRRSGRASTSKLRFGLGQL